MPLRNRVNVLNGCLINPRIHSLWIHSRIFFFILIWFLNITIIVSISFCSIFITWKWWWSFTDNIVPLRNRVNVLNGCLINPWIHALWIYSWVFFIGWFLHITIIVSLSARSIFISWKWRRRLTHNIMPLGNRVNVLNGCLINPRIHALWVNSGVFYFIFSFKLMEAA